MRPGRAFAAARVGGLRGLRVRELGEAELGLLVAFHEAAQARGGEQVLKADARVRLSADRVRVAGSS